MGLELLAPLNPDKESLCNARLWSSARIVRICRNKCLSSSLFSSFLALLAFFVNCTLSNMFLRSAVAGSTHQMTVQSEAGALLDYEEQAPVSPRVFASRLLFFYEIPDWQKDNEYIRSGYR